MLQYGSGKFTITYQQKYFKFSFFISKWIKNKPRALVTPFPTVAATSYKCKKVKKDSARK